MKDLLALVIDSVIAFQVCGRGHYFITLSYHRWQSQDAELEFEFYLKCDILEEPKKVSFFAHLFPVKILLVLVSDNPIMPTPQYWVDHGYARGSSQVFSLPGPT